LPFSTGGELLGNISATQSSIIVPKPLDSTVYYIFTVDFQLYVNGIRYSKADMTLNGGMGDIDPNEKNIPLMSIWHCLYSIQYQFLLLID